MGEHKSLDFSEISRLVELITEVSDREQCSPSTTIDSISRLVSPETSAADCRRELLASYVCRVRRVRTRRNELVGAPLFRDAAWDMLLELFVAHERGQELTITSLCYAAGVPPSTGTRQFQRLEEHGLITREGDLEDSRRFIVKPTPLAISSVATLAAMLFDDWQANGATSDSHEPDQGTDSSLKPM